MPRASPFSSWRNGGTKYQAPNGEKIRASSPTVAQRSLPIPGRQRGGQAQGPTGAPSPPAQENDQKRIRALKKANKERELKRQRVRELAKAKQEMAALRLEHQRLSSKLQDYSIFNKYLEKVVENSEVRGGAEQWPPQGLGPAGALHRVVAGLGPGSWERLAGGGALGLVSLGSELCLCIWVTVCVGGVLGERGFAWHPQCPALPAAGCGMRTHPCSPSSLLSFVYLGAHGERKGRKLADTQPSAELESAVERPGPGLVRASLKQSFALSSGLLPCPLSTLLPPLALSPQPPSGGSSSQLLP